MSEQTLGQRVRELVKSGNSRHVIFRSKSGSKLLDLSLTLTVIAGLFLFFAAGWLLLIGTVVGYLAGVRIEMISEVEDSGTVEINES